MGSLVYIVSPIDDQKLDISPAKRFGAIIQVNHRFVYGDELNGEALPAEFSAKMQRAALAFKPDTDYLLIAGDHLQMVAFAAMLGAEHGRFRALRWDRNERAYYSVMVNV